MGSGDTWAICLSRDGNKFWLVYTDGKKKDETFQDLRNYITPSPSVNGLELDSI